MKRHRSPARGAPTAPGYTVQTGQVLPQKGSMITACSHPTDVSAITGQRTGFKKPGPHRKELDADTTIPAAGRHWYGKRYFEVSVIELVRSSRKRGRMMSSWVGSPKQTNWSDVQDKGAPGPQPKAGDESDTRHVGGRCANGRSV